MVCSQDSQQIIEKMKESVLKWEICTAYKELQTKTVHNYFS